MSSIGAEIPVPGVSTLVPFIDFEESAVDERLAALRIARASLAWPELRLRAGETLALPAEADALRVGHRVMTTASLRTFKEWIGFDDEAIRDGRQVAAQFDDADPMTRLARMYLFGDSALVASHRAEIERVCAPFHAQMITAKRIVLEAGSTLRLETLPAIVVVDELVLRGGTLLVSSGTHATFGRVWKE